MPTHGSFAVLFCTETPFAVRDCAAIVFAATRAMVPPLVTTRTSSSSATPLDVDQHVALLLELDRLDAHRRPAARADRLDLCAKLFASMA